MTIDGEHRDFSFHEYFLAAEVCRQSIYFSYIELFFLFFIICLWKIFLYKQKFSLFSSSTDSIVPNDLDIIGRYCL